MSVWRSSSYVFLCAGGCYFNLKLRTCCTMKIHPPVTRQFNHQIGLIALLHVCKANLNHNITLFSWQLSRAYQRQYNTPKNSLSIRLFTFVLRHQTIHIPATSSKQDPDNMKIPGRIISSSSIHSSLIVISVVLVCWHRRYWLLRHSIVWHRVHGSQGHHWLVISVCNDVTTYYNSD